MEQMVYATQLLQAEAMRCGVEYLRSIRGVCMGSLYWQLGDCWPVASWSSIDYFGRWKGLHYAAKKFYAPVTVCVFLEDGRLRVALANETREDFEGMLKVKLCTTDLEVLAEEELDVEAGPLSATEVYDVGYEVDDPHSTFVCVELYEEGCMLARRSEMFVAPKHFSFKKPNVQVRLEQAGDKVFAYIKSDCYCKDVYLDFESFDCRLSDNFFDLTDKEEYRITIKTDRTMEELEKDLRILTAYDIGR